DRSRGARLARPRRARFLPRDRGRGGDPAEAPPRRIRPRHLRPRPPAAAGREPAPQPSGRSVRGELRRRRAPARRHAARGDFDRPRSSPARRFGAGRMRVRISRPPRVAAAALLVVFAPAAALAAPHVAPAAAAALGGGQTSGVIRIALVLTMMALIPALLVCMTSF